MLRQTKKNDGPTHMFNAITTPAMWDEYWADVQLPRLPDPSRNYERCFLQVFERHLVPDSRLTVFEAGCAPGMWLAYFSRRFGFQPYGCDLSRRGVELTQENWRLCGVAGDVLHQDFRDYKKGPFDIVISLGFIEHFADPAPVLRKTVALVKPGGTLVLAVPNHGGINRFFLDREWLRRHNRSVMRKSFFKSFAASARLETAFLGFLGGFEPANLRPPREAVARRAILKALRSLRKLPGAGCVNSRWCSGFLLGVFRRAKASPEELPN